MKKVFWKKGALRNALFVFIIAFSSFLAFEPLFINLKQNAAQEFASAIFGTIFAAVITMVLLSRQTETEEEKSRGEKVFEEKIKRYNEAMDMLQSIFEKADTNNQVSLKRSDIVELEFTLAKMIMVANEKTIHEFRLIYQNITKNYSSETNLLNLSSNDKHAIFRFADYCREELGLSDKNIEKEILEDIVIESELFYHLEGEASFSNNSLDSLKDIYGFLVFDLSIPLPNIVFQTNGFDAYNRNKKPFVKCNLNEEGLCVELLTKTNCKLKHFRLDDNNAFLIKPEDRSKFLEDFEMFQKALKSGFLSMPN